jgi:hypothetical protein
LKCRICPISKFPRFRQFLSSQLVDTDFGFQISDFRRRIRPVSNFPSQGMGIVPAHPRQADAGGDNCLFAFRAEFNP